MRKAYLNDFSSNGKNGERKADSKRLKKREQQERRNQKESEDRRETERACMELTRRLLFQVRRKI